MEARRAPTSVLPTLTWSVCKVHDWRKFCGNSDEHTASNCAASRPTSAGITFLTVSGNFFGRLPTRRKLNRRRTRKAALKCNTESYRENTYVKNYTEVRKLTWNKKQTLLKFWINAMLLNKIRNLDFFILRKYNEIRLAKRQLLTIKLKFQITGRKRNAIPDRRRSWNVRRPEEGRLGTVPTFLHVKIVKTIKQW